MKIDINAAPPTEQEIRKDRLALEAWSVGIHVAIIAPAIMLTPTYTPMARIVNGAMILLGVLNALLIRHISIRPRYSLAPDECAEMLELCNATPEGAAYRKAVLKQGRRFIRPELEALKERARIAATAAACKALYAVEASST
jgi:NAD(P)-dependent dehydrogenase (short-subunit alcohol dehydrogenase family)